MTTLTALNLVLSAINGYMAYDSFQRGHTRSGWISLTISALCFTSAVL